MAGYLEGYGAGEERREKIWKRIIVWTLVAVAVTAALYFTFRGYRQKQQVSQFLADLGRQDYQAAYRLWGCTPARPCRDYSFERFLEDWGQKSPRANAPAARVKGTKYCGHGVIVALDFGKGEETLLWVESKDLTLGFAHAIQMSHDPQIEVCLGAPRKVGQDILLPNDLHNRQEDRVVPVRHGFFFPNITLLVQPHKVAMDDDVFEQLLVSTRDGEADVLIRPEPVELRALQECVVLAQNFQVVRVNFWCDRHARANLDDFGVDEFDAVLTRYRHAVVSIQHKVNIANLV